MISLDWFSKKKRFQNGAQEVVAVSSDTFEFTHKSWFSDTYRLSLGLSKGDRSGHAFLVQSVEDGKEVKLATTSASVTQELWLRLCEFGYMIEGPGLADPTSSRTFKLAPGMHGRWAQFLLACRVDVLNESALKRVSIAFAKRRRWYVSLRPEALRAFQYAFEEEDVQLPPRKDLNEVYSEWSETGLIERKQGAWYRTSLGMVTVPFFFDHILFRKS